MPDHEHGQGSGLRPGSANSQRAGEQEGECGATLTFAGSLQGVTRTLPLEVYLQRETDPAAAVALSLVLVVVAGVVVGLVHRPSARERVA